MLSARNLRARAAARATGVIPARSGDERSAFSAGAVSAGAHVTTQASRRLSMLGMSGDWGGSKRARLVCRCKSLQLQYVQREDELNDRNVISFFANAIARYT